MINAARGCLLEVYESWFYSVPGTGRALEIRSILERSGPAGQVMAAPHADKLPPVAQGKECRSSRSQKPAIGANFISAVETGRLSRCHQSGSDACVNG